MITITNQSEFINNPNTFNKPNTPRNTSRIEHISQPVSRTNLKLKNTMHSPPIHPLSKGVNTHSTYLQRAKVQSFKVISELQLKDTKSQQLQHMCSKRFQKKQNTQFQGNIYNKSKGSKSFMIRKKNISSYSKKDDSTSRCELPIQDLHKQLMHQIISNSKEIELKVYHPRVGNSSENIRPKEIIQKNQPQLNIQHTLQTHSNCQNTSIKVKPVVCRESKQNKKYGRDLKDMNGIAVITNDLRDSGLGHQKNIEQLLKKIRLRNVSKSSFQNSAVVKIKQLTDKVELKQECRTASKSIHNGQEKQNKQEKLKPYSGCKTIRVPWGNSQGFSFNQIQNCQTQKQKLQFKHNSTKEVEPELNEQAFGCISIIPCKMSQNSSRTKNQNIPVESLRQLYDQLHKDDPTAINCIIQ